MSVKAKKKIKESARLTAMNAGAVFGGADSTSVGAELIRYYD